MIVHSISTRYRLKCNTIFLDCHRIAWQGTQFTFNLSRDCHNQYQYLINNVHYPIEDGLSGDSFADSKPTLLMLKTETPAEQ